MGSSNDTQPNPSTPSDGRAGGDCPQRRLQPQGQAPGERQLQQDADQEPREEVVGRGSGGTAGGPPATAAGDHEPAEPAPQAAEASPTFDPREFVGGGVLSNTPPPIPTLGGEDWLTVNLYASYACDRAFSRLRSALDSAQTAAKQEAAGSIVQIGDLECIVHASGATMGGSDRGVYCRWRLTTRHGITVLLSDRETPHRTQPSLQMRATSMALMRHGLAGIWELLQYLLEQMGVASYRDKLSRVDPCVDLPGTPVATYTEPFRSGYFVTRGRKKASHAAAVPIGEHQTGRRGTGFTVGKSPLGLRVYDKRLQAQNDPVALEVLDRHRWNGLPEHATRVEFQLGRATLKRLGVDSVADWVAKRADIVSYLTRDWFRLTEGPVDRKNPSRTRTHAMWIAVSDRFAECYGRPLGRPLAALPSVAPDPTRLLMNLAGTCKTILAQTGRRVANNEEFLAEVGRMLRAAIADRDMAEEALRRAIELGLEGLDLE